jgi:hypothetical protein
MELPPLSHLPRLKDHQLALLRRVADGPPVTSAESTLAASVYALRNRRLVTTPRSKGVWTAVIANAGHYYLEHSDYPPGESSVEPPARSKPVRAPLMVDVGGAELVARLVAQDGQITIVNPDRTERRRWRRAIHEAASESLVPAGNRISHTGRDKGDLVIRLALAERTVTRPKPVPVPVPERLGRPHSVIAATRAQLDRYKTHTGMFDTRRGSGVVSLKVTRAVLPRSLRIVNALFTAADLRGLTVTAGIDGLATIGAKGHNYLIAVSEITHRRPYQHSKTEIDRAARGRYRLYDRTEDVPTGELQLVLPQTWGHTPALRWRWRDTTRWKIEDRLGDLLDGIEARIDRDEQRRLEAERQAALQQEAEQRALRKARSRWIEDQRVTVLVEQVEAWRQAGQIRAWIAAVETDHQDPTSPNGWPGPPPTPSGSTPPTKSPDPPTFQNRNPPTCAPTYPSDPSLPGPPSPPSANRSMLVCDGLFYRVRYGRKYAKRTRCARDPAFHHRSAAHPNNSSMSASMSAEEIEPLAPSSVVTSMPLGPPPSAWGSTPLARYQASLVSHLRR